MRHTEGVSENESRGFVIAASQENRHTIDQQGSRKSIDHRSQHLVEVGLRAQITSELNERLAEIVTSAVEVPINAVLNPFAKWIKQHSGHDDREYETNRTTAGNPQMYNFGYAGNHSEVHCGDRSGSEGVDHAALEDQVHIHQPIPEYGVAECQRQKDQRQHRNAHQRIRDRSPEKWDDIEQAERSNRQDRPSTYPLELLPQDRFGRAQVSAPQNPGCQDEVGGKVKHLEAVQIPAQALGSHHDPKTGHV